MKDKENIMTITEEVNSSIEEQDLTEWFRTVSEALIKLSNLYSEEVSKINDLEKRISELEERNEELENI